MSELIAIRDVSAIVSPGSHEPVISQRSIFIRDGVILGVGDFSLLASMYGQPDVVLDGRKKVAIPGFYDLHTHIAMLGFRGLLVDADRPVHETFFMLSSEMDRETAYRLAVAGALEALKSGIVLVADVFFQAESVAEALESVGIRGLVGYCFINHEEAAHSESEIGRAIEFGKRWRENALVKPAIAPYSVDTVSREQLELLARLARELGVHLHVHLARSREEMKYTRELTGYTPVLYAYRLGLLGPRTIAAQANVVSEQERFILAQSGSLIAQCPSSSMLEGLPIHAYEYWQLGGNVAVGTDSPSLNDNIDFFEELRLMVYAQRVQLERKVWKAWDLLEVSTRRAAQLLGLRAGAIERGAEADIVLLDARRPWCKPAFNLAASIVYSASSGDVDTVIVRGKPVIIGGRHVALDEERALLQAEVAAMNFLEKILDEHPELESVLPARSEKEI
ncbi:MAG: amidohydrolase family protein [Thermofilum sp.]